MKHYKITFCGLGSIAKRHIKNVVTVLSQREATFEIDLYRNSANDELPEDIAPYITNVLSYSEAIPAGKEYDVVFVTNPTSVHYHTLLKFKDNTKYFFIEKPIFDTADIDKDIFNQLSNKLCYVACPLRYNVALQYVKENIPCQKAISVRAISSSYLPDWRPGQDYRKCYSAHRDMGGGVGLDLIHEWDFLTWLFGMPTQCYSIQSTISDLEIDSDDIAIYVARNKQTTFEVHLDYFGHSVIRQCEIFLPDETILCDIKNGRIDYLKAGRSVQLESERNDFQIREIEHFFKIINNEIINDSTAEHALQVLKLAKGKSL